VTEWEAKMAFPRAEFFEECRGEKVGSCLVNQAKHIIADLAERVLVHLLMVANLQDDLVRISANDTRCVPAFDLDEQDAQRWDHHDEIRVPVSDRGFVVRNAIAGQALHKFENPPLPRGRLARQPVRYQLSHRSLQFNVLAAHSEQGAASIL
jgi:hypothetical protein